MPTPDKRREYGSATEGSSRQVAASGQMAANVSTMSGGTGGVSAQPVLQIGQQSQIKDQGTALYEAISGTARGIQQGIDNYNQMFNMVSEKDFEKFQTEMIQESERVNGDPTKMKMWMDSSQYKPNRVTAKRYWGAHADITGKAYDEDQNDQWMSMQARMATMNQTEALAFLNETIPQYDENSPISKTMQSTAIKMQGEVAASTRSVNNSFMELRFKEQNFVTAEKLRPMYNDLSGPAMQAVFSARALGLVRIDEQSGDIIYKDQVFTPNSINDQLLQNIQNDIGEQAGLLGADYVGAAMQAAKLPMSVLRGNDPANKVNTNAVVEQSRTAAVTGSVDDFHTAVRGLPPSEDPSKVISTLNNSLKQIVGSTKDNPTNAMVALETFNASLEWTDENAHLWEDRGFSSKEEFDQSVASMRRAATSEYEGVISNSVAAISQQAKDQISTSTSIDESFDQTRFSVARVGELAARSGNTMRVHALEVAGFTESGAPITRPVELSMEDITDEGFATRRLIMTGVGIVEKESKISSKVPYFSPLGNTPTFYESGSQNLIQNTKKMKETVSETLQEVTEANAATMLKRGLQPGSGVNLMAMPAPMRDTGFNRIAVTDPAEAINILANSRFEGSAMDLFPAGDDTPARTAVLNMLTEDNIMNMSPDVRTGMNMAVTRSPKLLAALISDNKSPGEAAMWYQYSQFGPEDKVEFRKWARDSVKAFYSPDGSKVSIAWAQLPEDPKQLAELFAMDPTDNIEMTEDQVLQNSLLHGASTQFAATQSAGGGDLMAALKDPNYYKRVAAESWLSEWVTNATSMSHVLSSGWRNEAMLPQVLRNGSVQMQSAPVNPNDTYSPVGSATAEQQAVSELFGYLSMDRSPETVDGIAKALGFNSRDEFGQWGAFIDEGMPADHPKFNEYVGKMEDLESKVSFIGTPSGRIERAKNGQTQYDLYEYEVILDGILEDLPDAIRMEMTKPFRVQRHGIIKGAGKRKTGTQIINSIAAAEANKLGTEIAKSSLLPYATASGNSVLRGGAIFLAGGEQLMRDWFNSDAEGATKEKTRREYQAEEVKKLNKSRKATGKAMKETADSVADPLNNFFKDWIPGYQGRSN
jgi:hypothetical protein